MQIYTHMYTHSYIHTYWCWITSTRVQSTLRGAHRNRGRMQITNSLSDVFHTFLVQIYMKSHNLASCGKNKHLRKQVRWQVVPSCGISCTFVPEIPYLTSKIQIVAIRESRFPTEVATTNLHAQQVQGGEDS